MFQIGNRVIRTDNSAEIGTVIKVIPDVRGTPDITIYEVEFPSGRENLHGYELRALYPSCKEWQRLSRLCQKTSGMYFRIVSEQANAAGTVAHTEFALLRRRAEAARELCRIANEQLKEHSEKHGC